MILKFEWPHNLTLLRRASERASKRKKLKLAVRFNRWHSSVLFGATTHTRSQCVFIFFYTGVLAHLDRPHLQLSFSRALWQAFILVDFVHSTERAFCCWIKLAFVSATLRAHTRNRLRIITSPLVECAECVWTWAHVRTCRSLLNPWPPSPASLPFDTPHHPPVSPPLPRTFSPHDDYRQACRWEAVQQSRRESGQACELRLTSGGKLWFPK